MVAAAMHRRTGRLAFRGASIAAALAVAAGKVTGFAIRRSVLLPGLAGAAGFSLGLGGIAGHLFGHGLTPWVTLVVAGMFALRLDGQIDLWRTPRAGSGRGG